MGNSIIRTLDIMGWLGIILGILVAVNTICGIITNMHNGEKFSLDKLFYGLTKALIFYISAAATSIAFTMLPYINEMITNTFGVMLISNEVLNTLSSVSVLGVVTAVIIVQAKKALSGMVELAKISSNTEEVTWEVKIPNVDNIDNKEEQ